LYPFFACPKKRGHTHSKDLRLNLLVHFFERSKETNQRKGAQQLGLRLSSQTASARRRQELASLRQLGAFSRDHALRSATLQRGFKNHRPETSQFKRLNVIPAKAGIQLLICQ
jgi:hypothetical protein